MFLLMFCMCAQARVISCTGTKCTECVQTGVAERAQIGASVCVCVSTSCRMLHTSLTVGRYLLEKLEADDSKRVDVHLQKERGFGWDADAAQYVW